MIYWKVFITFFKIGLFNFGGGYPMISFIQNEVVFRHGWLSNAEFTDIVAVSQMTPGPAPPESKAMAVNILGVKKLRISAMA